MAAGFLYLILGIIIWLYKIVYFIWLIISDQIRSKYGDIYAKSTFLISFLINLLAIFFRLGSCYIIKKMYADVCTLEGFLHEKDQAEFLQSLGTKGDDERLCDDEEIVDGNLVQGKNNPFFTGRKKKDEIEEEEINFESTL